MIKKGKVLIIAKGFNFKDTKRFFFNILLYFLKNSQKAL
jgi:hypothetical protein